MRVEITTSELDEGKKRLVKVAFLFYLLFFQKKVVPLQKFIKRKDYDDNKQ